MSRVFKRGNLPALRLSYSDEGIPTMKEGWYGEPKEQGGNPAPETEALEYARKVSERIETSTTIEEHARQIAALLRARAQARTAASELEQKFYRLADQWRRETAHYSLTFKRAMHPAYQQIIGMGQSAIPYILRELQERPTGHWFWALSAISGEDPARAVSNLDEAIRSWLLWGRERGHI